MYVVLAGNPLNTFTQDFNTNFLQTSNSGSTIVDGEDHCDESQGHIRARGDRYREEHLAKF